MKKKYFAYRSFWPEPEAHRNFAAIGGKTVCFFPSNVVNSLGEPYCKYPPNWVGENYSPEGQYDFAPVDEQLADLMQNCPEANFICMIDLNTPDWLCKNILRCDSFTHLGCICSDPVWRRVTAKYMRNLLLHLETNYAARLEGYVLSCGNTSEWYDLSALSDSPSRLDAWMAWREKMGLPPEDIPGPLARKHLSFENLLRDPKKDGSALQYIRFCAEQIADTVQFFLREARKTIRPAAELGIFFGYPLCMGMEGERITMGQNDCSELLKCPELDFIIAPSGYFSKIGDGGGDLGPLESVQLHGKEYLRECDQKTHSMNRKLSKHVTFPPPYLKNEAETLAVIKREFSYTLIKQCSCWWFDMWGGFYDSPAVLRLLGQCRELYDQQVHTPAERIAEIALIVDTDSIYYLNQNDASRPRWFYADLKRALDQIGAPYECYNFNDIPHIPRREQIKLWLLPGCFELTSEKHALLEAHILREQKTLLTMYAPGISDGHSLDPARVEKLTGVPFATPGINVVKRNGFTSVYCATGPDLTTDSLREIAAQHAGVHIFTDKTTPVYANSRFLAVHTAQGGPIHIKLPRQSETVREVFSDRLIATNCQQFTYHFQTPDTALFAW